MNSLKKLCYILAVALSAMLVACHSMEEPRREVGLGRHIDERELEAIHILYDSLHLSALKEYKNWVTSSDLPGVMYTPLQDLYATARYGLTFGVDTVTNCYVVTEMRFDRLPNREDLCLPDIFDRFKHLKVFTMRIPPLARVKFPPSLCECPLTTLHLKPQKAISPYWPGPFKLWQVGSYTSRSYFEEYTLWKRTLAIYPGVCQSSLC